jgi:hypothetical protein
MEGTPRVRSRISYPCPHEGCGAGAGQSCRRYVRGLIDGVDVGGGQWKTLKHLHKERKIPR